MNRTVSLLVLRSSCINRKCCKDVTYSENIIYKHDIHYVTPHAHIINYFYIKLYISIITEEILEGKELPNKLTSGSKMKTYFIFIALFLISFKCLQSRKNGDELCFPVIGDTGGLPRPPYRTVYQVRLAKLMAKVWSNLYWLINLIHVLLFVCSYIYPKSIFLYSSKEENLFYRETNWQWELSLWVSMKMSFFELIPNEISFKK